MEQTGQESVGVRHGFSRHRGMGRHGSHRRRTWKPSPRVRWALALGFLLLVLLIGLLADH